jgi:hypothetical protein
MGVLTRPKGCSGAQQLGEAAMILCSYLEAFASWKKARDSYEQNTRRAVFRAALEELYQFLYPDIKQRVTWFLKRVETHTTDEQSQLLVMNEVVDAYVMNVFASITPALPTIVIEEQTDVHAELLALVEQNLYYLF